MTALRPAESISDEIRSVVAADDLPRAVRRLLDYAKQISGDRMVVNNAIVLAREIHELRREANQYGPGADDSVRLNRLANRMLALVDEIEAAIEDPRATHPAVARPRLRVVGSEPVGEDRDAAAEPAAGEPPTETRLERLRQSFRADRQPAPADEGAVVVTRALTKRFRDTFTLEEIDLRIEPGEIVGLIGVNGSGKTTLLRILAGELSPDSGSLAYPTLSPGKLDWRHLHRRIAYVPQRPPRWESTLEDNLYLQASVHGITGQDNEDEVDFILHRLGLEHYRRARWHQISGGFQMRFELARALVAKPDFLILDEPLAPLDINTQQIFLQDLQDIARSLTRPLPIILSSQNIYETEAVADKILFLDGGRPAFFGTLDDLADGRRENTYELLADAEKADLAHCLRALSPLRIDFTGLTFLVGTSLEVTGGQVLDALQRDGLEVRYFRDVTRSCRNLFQDRGVAP